MIKYSDLVQYIKVNHISWDTDLFDVLREFFNKDDVPCNTSIEQELVFPSKEFQAPENGEYTINDLIKLFT